MGDGWTCLPPKDEGPNEGWPYELCRHENNGDSTVLSDQEERDGEMAMNEDPHHSPLTRELDLLSEVTSLLDDYDDIAVDQGLDQDLEIATP